MWFGGAVQHTSHGVTIVDRLLQPQPVFDDACMGIASPATFIAARVQTHLSADVLDSTLQGCVQWLPEWC